MWSTSFSLTDMLDTCHENLFATLATLDVFALNRKASIAEIELPAFDVPIVV